jgi:hypothetical protein
MRNYRFEVWDLIENFFLAFNIYFFPREENTLVDSLFVFYSNFKVPLPTKLKYDVEVKYRPSILDNVKHWKVFEDDLEIKIFMKTVEEFPALHIDQKPNDENNPHADKFLNKISDQNIVQLPRNHIPKGLVPLERLFDSNDVAVKVRGSNEDVDLKECNLGTDEDPMYVKLSSSLLEKQRADYVKLLKEFSNVFAWKYDDLKTYDKSIIEHKIPLKDDTKPFRHKLRNINPMLFPSWRRRSKNCLMLK